ncbi:MAG: hypothetical protein ABH868_06280 [bacterium]
MLKKIVVLMLLVCFSFSFTACGKFNLFSWAHKKGSSSDTETLIADGNSALNNKDYGNAKTYFNKVLDGHPDNAEALYGYSRAEMGASGLGIADIISAVIQEATSNSAPLPPTVRQGEYGNLLNTIQLTTGIEDLFPESLNLTLLYNTANLIVPKLKKIADGSSDGKIPADDVDVNVNLGILLAIRGACRLLDTDADGTPGGASDLIEVYDDFDVKLPTQAELDALTEAEILTMRDQVQYAIWDIVGGGTSPYDKGATDYILVAVSKVSAGLDSALDDLKDNINEFESDTTEGIAALKDTINDYITDQGYDIDPIS